MPWYFKLAFSAVFAASVPFLIKRVVSARTRQVTFDTLTRKISVRELTPLSIRHRQLRVTEIEGLEFNAHDNYGYWYTASLKLADGTRVASAQGSYEPDVRERHDDLLHRLQKVVPDITLENTST